MKILPILLINLVVTGGALVIYDQMQGPTPGTTYDMGGTDGVEIEDIRTRLARLERDGGSQPMLSGDADESLLHRVEALENRAGRVPPRSMGSDASEGGDAPARADGGPNTIFSEDGDITSDDVNRFRRLMDAANEQRRMEREREQLASLLERLEISMDDKQQEQYIQARRDRQRKVGEMFRGLPRGPNVDRDEVRAQLEASRTKINEEFALTINKFLPAGDATKLAEHEGNSRWGRTTRGRRGGDR